MNETAVKLISMAYATVGILGLAAYIPTIKDLYHHRKPSANINSYYLWTTSTFITLLYSLFVLNDTLFRMVSTLNFLACVSVLLLAIALRKRGGKDLQ